MARDFDTVWEHRLEKEPSFSRRQRIPKIPLTVHGAVRCAIARLCATCGRPLVERCGHE